MNSNWDEIDVEIRPLVRLLNEQPGIHTLFSCAGHYGDDAVVSGYVTMRIDSLDNLISLVRKIGINVLTGCRQWATGPDYIKRIYLDHASIECSELDEDGVVFTLRIEGYPLRLQRERLGLIEAALSRAESKE